MKKRLTSCLQIKEALTHDISGCNKTRAQSEWEFVFQRKVSHVLDDVLGNGNNAINIRNLSTRRR
jgi:hypothetical protein